MSGWEDYLAALTRWRAEAGQPSSRRVAAMIGPGISHTTVNNTFNGRRLPSRATSRAILTTLGCPPDVADDLWTEARLERNEAQGTPITFDGPPSVNSQMLDELRAIRHDVREMLELMRDRGEHG